MADYKEKIRKLLALSKSPNEHEARAALLKARELMADHKLTEAELKDIKAQDVKEVQSGISCSKRRNPWIVKLSNVIAGNFCCRAFRTSYKGRQIQKIGFIGFEEDADICTKVFQYAVDCVMAEIKRIKKDYQDYYSSYVKKLCDSYGYGFAYGVYISFERQQEEKAEEGWGLVMVVPKEVIEATEDFHKEDFHSNAEKDIYGGAYFKGCADGKKFDPSRRLGGA